MASEVYRISVGVGVEGVDKSKKELSAMDKVVEKSEKRLKKLDKIQSNPAIKLQDKLSKPLDKIDNKIGSFVKSGIKKFTAFATAASVIVGGIGLGATMSTYMDFESQMSATQAVTRATAEEMEQLQATARQLGRDTSWTATEVGQAEELLGQAGFTVQQNIAALPGLLNLASAGGLELAEATDIAAGTIKAFGMEAEEAARVSDVLALASSKTNADVSGLGEGMKYVAPLSRSLGISFEETTAALGMLNDANIKGGQAGTVLRTALSSLSKPSKEAKELMKDLGFNAFDAKGNMKPLSTVIDELGVATKDLTKEQKANAMATIFGQTGMTGMLALIDAAPGSMAGLTAALEDSTGAAQEMADTRLDNLAGQLELLGSAADDVKLTLGEQLAPITRELVEWAIAKMPLVGDKILEIATKAKELAGKVIPVVEKIIGVVKKFSPVIAGVAAALGSLKVGSIIAGIAGKAINAGSMIGGAIGKVSFAFKAVSGGAATLAEGMTFLMSPIGWVALAIGAAVTAGILLYKNWDKIKEAATQLKENLTNAFNNIKTSITETFNGIKEGISNAISTVKETVVNVFNGIKEGIANTIQGIKETVLMTFESLPESITEPLLQMKEALFNIFEGVAEMLTGVWEVIKNIVLGAILIITDIITLDFEMLAEDIAMIWENISEGFSMIWEGIKQIFTGALEYITGYMALAWAVMKETAAAAWEGIKSVVSGVIEWFTTLPGRLLEIGVNIFTSFAEGIASMVGTVREKATQVKDKVVEAVKDLPSQMLQAGKDAMTGLANGIKSMISAPFKAAKSAASKVGEGIRNTLKIKSPSRVTMEYGEFTTEGLALGVARETPKLEKVVSRTYEVVTPGQATKDGSSQPRPTPELAVATGGGGGGNLVIQVGDTVFNGGQGSDTDNSGVSEDDIRSGFKEVIDQIVKEWKDKK